MSQAQLIRRYPKNEAGSKAFRVLLLLLGHSHSPYLRIRGFLGSQRLKRLELLEHLERVPLIDLQAGSGHFQRTKAVPHVSIVPVVPVWTKHVQNVQSLRSVQIVKTSKEGTLFKKFQPCQSSRAELLICRHEIA